MLLRCIRSMPYQPDNEKAAYNGREAQEHQGEQESLETAARSLLLMPFML